MQLLKLLCVIMTVLFLTGVWWGGPKDETYIRYATTKYDKCLTNKE